MVPDANHGVSCTWYQQFEKYNELVVGCARSIQKKNGSYHPWYEHGRNLLV
jgi:hypothetical protein